MLKYINYLHIFGLVNEHYFNLNYEFMNQNYLINNESINFIIDSRNQTGEINQLCDLLTSPRSFADKYNIPISNAVEQRLLRLGEINSEKSFTPDDPINKEVTSFFNDVLIDGRFIEEWVTEPENVAIQLGLTVSPEAIIRIRELNLNELIDTTLLIDPNQINQTQLGIVLSVVLVVVFVLIPTNTSLSLAEVIVDPNTMNKV